ncbi:nitroreductase [Paracoccus lutimaris]|uniref:Nitroreductase n=1 Tax=Paracoccus lutimaris TaxID=1490030 RepID=A0A368YMG1_9RHOB|nr:nitroreductase [Paracoccus lutimaris]RCW80779.1 nitroreductase [Paracoccus lutimaris]
MTLTPVEETLFGRRSVRAYLGTPVPRPDIERICRAARTAPSGANLQPGAFHVLTGDALAGLSRALLAAIEAGAPVAAEYSYFPDPMPPELKARQRAAGYALYAALGIPRRDLQARRAQFDRNYAFFDAPVGIVVTIDRQMGAGCFMDLGMALMAFQLAAEGLGYATSGIGALANYGPVAHAHLNLPADEMVVCGLALGRPDHADPVNGFRTERAELGAYTRFYGFTGES